MPKAQPTRLSTTIAADAETAAAHREFPKAAATAAKAAATAVSVVFDVVVNTAKSHPNAFEIPFKFGAFRPLPTTCPPSSNQ